MDQSHHPQQWHSRPIHAALCPICSVPHFPFCPPPHSFVRNPHSFQTPFFDPYRMPVRISRPFAGNPNEEFCDRRQWNRHAGMDRDSYGQFPFQLHREGFPPPPCEYGSNGYIGEAERNYKRPRVDDISSSSFVQQDFNKKNSGVLSDNERLSKLIRDHGSMQIGVPEGESNPMQRVSFGSEAEANSSSQESSIHERVQNVIASGDQTESRNFGTNRMELQSLATRHADTNSLREADFGRGDGRKISTVAPAKQFIHQKINGSNYSDSDNQQTTSGAIAQFQRNSLTMEVHGDGNQPPLHYPMRHSVRMKHDFPSHGTQNINAHRGYYPSGGGTILENAAQMEASRLFMEQPPLPTSPPPPLPGGAPSHSNMESRTFPSHRKPSSLFPVSFNTSMVSSSSCPPVHEVNSNKSYFHNNKMSHAATGFVMEENQSAYQTSSDQFATEGQSFALKHLSSGIPKVVYASQLFMLPHRVTRPDHIVVILRGLPGSGKSYLAKMLRDLEVENGGKAPRVHSMDDYFMTEVEKIEDGDAVKSSSSVKAKKKPVVKTVMEYCYEPEMEEAYRSSMLKAFRKTLEEGDFTFVIVDDRNLRVADFAQFWAIAKSSGYEVYLLEATYRDPAGCAARNVHGFTLDSIQKMAAQWEEAPALYLRLDIKSLFHGDDLKESGIQEVDMDMDMGDEDNDEGFSQKKLEKTILLPIGDDADKDDRKQGEAEPGNHKEEVKELGRSKWSDDLDEDEDGTKGFKGKSTALTGLFRVYTKNEKSVHWSDQGVNTGFSIGAVKKANALSLIIGPGAGYNLKSNPLLEDDNGTLTRAHGELKKQSVFQQQLQAEQASFKAVFDKRRQRVGLDWEEE